uniref:V-set and transmembrane domain containing 4a n=1 Tax=Lates calcarifer TaxID=8187 RepID=A0A4W6CA43_LATCA
MYFSIVVLVLTKALVTEVCHALNVTVTPGPIIMVTEKDNLTLSCLVSQRKRSSSVLILRWFFSPLAVPTLTPPLSSTSPSPPTPEPSQFLIVKMGIKKMKLYGNYTRQFPQPKFRLYEETEGELYRLRIFSVTGKDQGFYTCKVQEIRKHRNTWRASSNGTSTTQLTGN